MGGDAKVVVVVGEVEYAVVCDEGSGGEVCEVRWVGGGGTHILLKKER